MLDLIMLLLIVVCFILAHAYANLCDRLLTFAPNDSAQDISP